MAYVAPGARTFREMKGDLDTKIVGELAKIDTELDLQNSSLVLRPRYGSAVLSGGNANAFCMAWANPSTVAIIIQKITVRTTTAGGTGGAVLDFGTAANGTTHADNLIDGADANAVAVYDNITDKGINGKTAGVLLPGESITGQILTQNAAALVGKAYIAYIPTI